MPIRSVMGVNALIGAPAGEPGLHARTRRGRDSLAHAAGAVGVGPGHTLLHQGGS